MSVERRGGLRLLAGLLGSVIALGGCSAAQKPEAQLPSLVRKLSPAPVLVQDHFQDRAGRLSEEHLLGVLEAPVFLEQRARLGVLQVTDRYQSDGELPLTGVPAVLSESLGRTGLFEVTTEISSDWPAEQGISGLRELAARYRSEYLLLYRHRFVQDSYTNGWGWTFFTLVGLFVAPAETVRTSGVLEATLFDVKTGTILFTAFERVGGETDATLFNGERKSAGLRMKLLADAARRLADQAVAQCRVLAELRPVSGQEQPDPREPAPARPAAGEEPAPAVSSALGSPADPA